MGKFGQNMKRMMRRTSSKDVNLIIEKIVNELGNIENCLEFFIQHSREFDLPDTLSAQSKQSLEKILENMPRDASSIAGVTCSDVSSIGRVRSIRDDKVTLIVRP